METTKTAEFPILGKIEYESPNKTNVIYEAAYRGLPCFCIQHIPSGHIEIIDHNKAILNAIITKIKRCGALVCEKKTKQPILKFRGTEREYNISLRLYVFAKYRHMELKEIRGKKIVMHDSTLAANNIADLRKCNLYAAGDFRPIKPNSMVEIIYDQENAEKQCIVVKVREQDRYVTEIYPYSEELYEILSSSKWGCLQYCKDNGRLVIGVHCQKTKDGYKLVNLSRFVLLYNTHFHKYSRRKGAIKQFIRDFSKLSDDESNQAAHINAAKWNGGNGNLVWMEEDVNRAMSNLITHFSGDYEIFAVADDNAAILIEFLSHGQKHYYRCNSASEYLDLQSVLMGKCNLTKNLCMNKIAASGAISIPTPKETYQERKTECTHNEDMIAAYWEWNNRRDSLIDLYKSNPDNFRDWGHKAKGITIQDVTELINLFMGDVIKTNH